jgi:poly(3-hydroxybutyrate) depolymerase
MSFRVPLLLLFVVTAMAQENPWLRLDGRWLRDVNPDDARLLGIIARGLTYQADKKASPANEVRQLMSATTDAYVKQDLKRAYRLVVRLNTILAGETPDEATEVSASVDFQLDRRIVAPGNRLRALIRPLFAPEKPLAGVYQYRVTVRAGSGPAIHSFGPESLRQLTEREHSIATAALKEGHYFADFELATEDGKTLTRATRDFYVYPELKPRLEAVRTKLATLNAAQQGGLARKAALETIEYIIELHDRLTKEYVADMNRVTHPMVARMRGQRLSGYTSDLFRYPRDLDFADELAGALLKGSNPFKTRTGDMRMAHRSAIDQSLQPFRVYVPRGYDASRRYPLIVALHGATGDENTYMDRYNLPDGSSLFQKLADERGYILATPNGRGPYGMYVENSETDVLEVLDRVQALYPIRAGEVFLTGHSMGGGGTWHIGFAHPKRFRALAPVASGFGGRLQTRPSIPLKSAPEMPVLFSYGLKDTLATPENSKRLAEYAQSELKNFQAKEFPDDHFVIGITSMPHVFDFFDSFRAKD